ncbi:hypothetical protein BDZ89DRAFT_1047116 [Hymenopellis radicata]|nr:hypothetical protein BDZ89DRAFT_1047116 [Hymenopellis radicata]
MSADASESPESSSGDEWLGGEGVRREYGGGRAVILASGLDAAKMTGVGPGRLGCCGSFGRQSTWKASSNNLVSIMCMLQGMTAGLQVIRGRVTGPSIAMTLRSLDFNEQSIQSGLLRLKDSSLQMKEREKTALSNLILYEVAGVNEVWSRLPRCFVSPECICGRNHCRLLERFIASITCARIGWQPLMVDQVRH